MFKLVYSALRKEEKKKKSFSSRIENLVVKGPVPFVAFVEDNATMNQYRFWKITANIFCAKPKEVDPINSNFCITKNFSIALKDVINNEILK